MAKKENELDKTLQKLGNADSLSASSKNNCTLDQMEKFMINGFSVMQKSLVNLIERKINVTNTTDNGGLSYKSVDSGNLKGLQKEIGNKVNNTVTENFRSIMMSTRNEELAEEREKRKRSCNIIIHGKEEKNTENLDDVTFVDMLLITTECKKLSTKSIKRIGNPDKSYFSQ